MTWMDQMHTLVSLPEKCGTNHWWADWIWSTDTSAPGLLLVSLLMDPYLPLFVLHCLLLAVTNMHDEQRGTSSFMSRNLYGGAPNFASINMYLGWKWDNLSFQGLNSCCKGDSTPGNIMLSICFFVILFDFFI